MTKPSHSKPTNAKSSTSSKSPLEEPLQIEVTPAERVRLAARSREMDLSVLEAANVKSANGVHRQKIHELTSMELLAETIGNVEGNLSASLMMNIEGSLIVLGAALAGDENPHEDVVACFISLLASQARVAAELRKRGV